MKKILLITLVLFASFLYSQHRYTSDSFEASKYDLQINEFPQDSTANAIVIFEEGNSYVDKKSYDLKTEIKRKIKILKKDRTDKATIEIYLYKGEKDKEKVSQIKAETHNIKNGKIVRSVLLQSAVFNENYSDKYDIVKFTMPNVQDGSVITYSYTITSPFMFNYHGWSFQSDIPKMISIYNTSIPANWEYNIKLIGHKDLDVNNTNLDYQCLKFGLGGYSDCTVANYVMKDIPAFIEEDYMTSARNYRSRIEYELSKFTRTDGGINRYTKTWKDTDKEFKSDESLGKQLNKVSLVKNLIPAEKLQGLDALEKAKAIYDYVQKNYEWNEKYNIFNDVSIKETLKERTGNVSSLNIILHNLLKANDIDVSPVLLSTRSNGFITKLYPVFTDFNYLINKVSINDKVYFLDATENYLSFGELPYRCLNWYGRELDFKNGSDWVDIKPGKISGTKHKVKLTLSDDAVLAGKLQSTYNGYHSFRRKESYFTDPNKYIEDFESSNASFEVVNHEVATKAMSDEKFQETFEISYEDLSQTNNELFVNPFIYKFFSTNPFKLQERTYPIDFGYKDSYIYSFQLEVDEKYTVSKLPESGNFQLPNNKGSIIYSFSEKNNTVLVYFKLSFKDSFYEPEYYSYLKELMNKVTSIVNQSDIVITQK